MSNQSISLLALTAIAAGAVAAHRFVTPGGAQATDGDNTLGVSRQGVANGESFTVDVLGTAVIESGAPFSAGDTLKADADGKGITWVTSGGKVAVALQAATGAGQLVEVLLIPNAA